MGNLVITNIIRNPGALLQTYTIQYKEHNAVTWINGPTLTYQQASTYNATTNPQGQLPITIPAGDPADYPDGIDVRVVTGCPTLSADPDVSVNGTTDTFPVNTNPCE